MESGYLIHAENLALELTRRCNLNCRHCSRGKAEDKCMSDEVIDKIFSKIDMVNLLQFVGGETTLVPDRLRATLEAVKKYETRIATLLMFTNGTNISDEVIQTLNEFREYILTSNAETGKQQENYAGLVRDLDKNGKYPVHVIVSIDKYHLESAQSRGISKDKIRENIELLTKNFPVEIEKMSNYGVFNVGGATNIEDTYKIDNPTAQYVYKKKKLDKDGGYFIIGPVIGYSYSGKLINVYDDYKDEDAKGVGDILQNNIFDDFKLLKPRRCFSKLEYHYVSRQLAHSGPLTTTKRLQKIYEYFTKREIPMDWSYFSDKTASYDEVKTPKPKV